MGIEKLKFLRLKFSLTAKENIFFPKNLKGNIFRGAFGMIFKKLHCHSIDFCVDRCKNANCLYGKIFEPYFSDAASGLKNLPRPFILTFTNEERETIFAGESFNIGFNLFGWCCDYYPHFIKAVEEIGNEGIGPFRGKFVIRKVYSIDLEDNIQEIYDPNNAMKEVFPFTIPQTSFTFITTVFKINLKTPTKIIYNENVINDPDFYHIFLRIRDRLSSIAYFYNSVDLETDYKALEEKAMEVSTIKKNWKFVDIKRRSTRTRKVQDLSGIVGYGIYDFGSIENAELFYPWLKAAELTGIGKNTVWGMGLCKFEFNLDKKGVLI